MSMVRSTSPYPAQDVSATMDTSPGVTQVAPRLPKVSQGLWPHHLHCPTPRVHVACVASCPHTGHAPWSAGCRPGNAQATQGDRLAGSLPCTLFLCVACCHTCTPPH